MTICSAVWRREQQAQFEERLLTSDDEFYEELVIVEDELMDEYLRRNSRRQIAKALNRIFSQLQNIRRNSASRELSAKYVAAESEARPQESSAATQ